MSTHRKIAVIVGLLFLTSFVASLLGSQAFIAPIINASDYPINVYPDKNQLIIGVLLELICAVEVAGIAIMMQPILKKHNNHIALGYLSLRIVESAIIFVSAISLLSLVTLGQEYVEAGTLDVSLFQPFGTFAAAMHYYAFQMVTIVCGLAGLMFCYSLYQLKLIPRSISVLGLIGYPLSFIAALLDVFGLIGTPQGVGLMLYLPGSLFEILLLPLWLIIKGFSTPAIETYQTKQILIR